MNITEYPYNGACNHIFSIDLNNSDWKPDTYFITAKVTISGTTYSSDAVTLKVTKANQSLSAPTASEVSPD